MSFIIQRIEGSKVILNEYKASTLRIGRGTDAQLRSENSAVAFEHAEIEANEGGFDLIDRGSITGTYLNGRAIETSRLGKGDEIEIGDLRITIQLAEPGKPLFLRVETTEEEDSDIEAVPVPVGTVNIPKAAPGAQLKAPKVDYVASYQLQRKFLSKTVLSWVALLVGIATLALIIVGKQTVAFRPGKLSVAHTQAAADGVKLINENNCVACHEAWGGATDRRCQACHKQAGHQEGLAQVGSCIACHSEHRALPNIKQVWQQQCIDCHKDLKPDPGKTIRVAKSITRFDKDHPEFTLNILVNGQEKRVSLADPVGRKSDSNKFKFNHQCHLLGTCNKRPPTLENPNREVEKLTCDSCHKVQGDTGLIDERSYDKYCSRCHPLTFDNRFPPVPHHLNLQTVAGYIANAYSGNQNILKMSAEEVTRVFAQGTGGQVNVGSEIVRNAQRAVQTRCMVCHEFQANGEAVRPPNKSNRWFKGVRTFNHVDHLNEAVKTKCIDCHEGVLQSQKTADVNMPGIKSCTGCHKEASEYKDKGIDTCQTCHYYHSLTVKYGKGWTLQATVIPADMKLAAMGGGSSSGPAHAPKVFGLPLWAAFAIPIGAVLLLGVSGAIVGLAKTRVKQPDLPPIPPKPATPAPKPAAPPATRTPKARPAAPAPPPEVPASTVAMDISDARDMVAKAVSAKGTVATDWYGGMTCIGGKIQGQQFTIDPQDGTYIGRDKEVANVVIEDSRISRRHLWIGVKDGKVFAVDQSSTNGSYLNALSNRITQAELKGGDVVILGENAAVFRYDP